MPIKWKLFGLANYFFLLIYVFLLLGALRFTAEKVMPDENLSSFMPFMISLFMIVINSVFNLWIFHMHIPDKPLSTTVAKLYLLSAIFYALSLIIVIIEFISITKNDLTTDSADGIVYFFLSIFFLTLFIGGFILFNQFLVRKFIEKNYSFSLQNRTLDTEK